jgi:hypothetical protein
MLRALLRAADALAMERDGCAGAADAVAPDLLRLETDGGWPGGDARLQTEDEGERIEAAILDGRARIRRGNVELTPMEVVYAPWGFRMLTGTLLEGVSYAAGLAPPAGPQRLSVMRYGPGLMDFGPRRVILAQPPPV